MKPYEARYFGEHCGIEKTVTASGIATHIVAIPTLPDHCMVCGEEFLLVLTETGTELGPLDDLSVDEDEP